MTRYYVALEFMLGNSGTKLPAQCMLGRRGEFEGVVDWLRFVTLLWCLAGREWSDWSQELRVTGDELRWKFTSDGSVNGWGWRFVVYPMMPSAAPLSFMSDRTVLSRPSIDLATCLLDLRLQTTLAAGGGSSVPRRLTAALAACAQLGSLS